VQSKSLLDEAIEYLQTQVRPRAQDIDLNIESLQAALDGMAERGFLAMRRPEAYGGPNMPDEDFRRFQEEVARSSGSLSFLQTQHQSAVSILSKGDNEALKLEYLPKMANGEKLIGIGFSQLRRAGPPIMRAEETDGGYLLDGHVPWVTGWSFYPEFLVGAALPDGRSIFAIVPLVKSDRIGISEPMKLAAMESAQTVTVDFSNYFVPSHKVSAVVAPGWIQTSDEINVALQRHFALGCARGALDILLDAAEKKGFDFLREAYDSLSAELTLCRAATSAGAQTGPATDARLEARAWAIELSVRCAHAAIAASSGAANSLNHPAQRVYREALVYTVSAQTVPIMEATLKRLAH
jgi:alkylation response protein AidB-like acyl-CoA dehydrogenase